MAKYHWQHDKADSEHKYDGHIYRLFDTYGGKIGTLFVESTGSTFQYRFHFDYENTDIYIKNENNNINLYEARKLVINKLISELTVRKINIDSLLDILGGSK